MHNSSWLPNERIQSGAIKTIQSDVMGHIANQMSEAVLLFGLDGKILYYNNAANRLLHIDSLGIVVLNISDFITESGFSELSNQLKIVKPEDPLQIDQTFFRNDLPNLCCQCVLSKVNEYFMLLIRSAQEVETTCSPNTYKSVFDHAINGMIVTDDKSRIIDVNSKGCEFLELEHTQLVGQSLLQELKRMDIRLTGERKLDKLFNNHLNQTISTLSGSEGERQYELLTIPGIQPDLNLTILRDVTEIMNIMDQLNKTDTLKVVGQLAAGIAHEIRNPMTALKGFIQLLQASVKEDHTMYFNVILSELQRIEAILTEFLMLAKPKKSSYETINLVETIQETVDLMAAQATMNNVRLIFQNEVQSAMVHGEPHRLKQVFINIVKNAIEAIESEGTVTFSLYVLNDTVQIKITDTGCGISESQLKRLNEPFYTTKENGTGLGLPVTFKIIEEHGGTFNVTSEVGEGTTFSLTFPVQ